MGESDAADPSGHDALLELYRPPVRIATDYKDSDGRPLGELSSSEPLRRDVEFRTKVARYAGSRAGKEINLSALRQLTGAWTAILGFGDAVRRRHASRHGLDAGPLTLGSLWQLSRVGAAFPAYLLRRASPTAHAAPVSSPVSGYYKALAGVTLTAESMLLAGIAPDSTSTVEDYLDYTERRGLYVARGFACAGPLHLIREFLTALRDGLADATHEDTLAIELGEVDRAFDYGDETTALAVARFGYLADFVRATRALLARLGDEGERGSAHVDRVVMALLPEVARAPEASTPLESLVMVRDHFAPRFARPGATPDATRLAAIRRAISSADDGLEPWALDVGTAAMDDALAMDRWWASSFAHQLERIRRALGDARPAVAIGADEVAPMHLPSFTRVLTAWLRLPEAPR